MDKIKKILGFLVFPFLFLMMLFPTVEAQAATDVTSKVQIDHLEITIASTGSKTEGIHGENDTSMKLKYSGKFSFPNVAVNEIKDGDYFIVKAPDNLSLTDGSLDLIDSTSNIKMGTVQVDNANHRLVFTFNDKVKDKQNIRGDFVAEATETLQKEGKTVTYVFPNGKTQTITYKVNKYQQTDVIGETITKYGYNDNNKARAHFQMKINRAKQDMTGHVVKITDDISKGAFATYIEGTFYLNEAEFETTNTNSSAVKSTGKRYEITTDEDVYQADSDNKALLRFINGKRGFELLMPTNMGTKSFFLTYDSTSPADTSTISNSAQYLIDNEPQLIWKKYGNVDGTKTEATFNVKTVKSVGATITADITGKIKITKFDEEDATVKLDGVVFEIVNKNNSSETYTVTTDENGVALSPALSDGQYIVKEKTPKAGYVANSQEFEVEMKDGKGVPLNISNKRETVDFEATKTWVNGKATDYKEVKLGLYVHKEGQTVSDAKPVTGNYTPEVTVSNGVYTYKWKSQLPERDVDGSKLVYSVRELEDQTGLPLKEGAEVVVGENNYVVSYDADNTHVTNTYEVPKTNVTAKKAWTGGQEHIRPTVYFKLYRTPEGGAIEEVAGVEKKEVPKTDGTVEWTDLPATDEHGVKYTYSVMEVDEEGNLVTTVDGYTVNQTAGLTVTNTYSTSPTKADIKVKKELTGGRPTPLQNEEFEFILKDKNGQEVQRAKNDANGDVVFKDIPFTQEGNYQYTIVEVKAGTTENGITYDAKTVTAKVTVTDDAQGKLHATVEYSSDGAANSTTFTNVYTPAGATTVTLGAKKVLEGKALEADKYSFVLKKEDGSVVETVKNAADGSVTFAPISYDESQVGTHKYTISEVEGDETGITYDKTVQEVEVTVKKVSATELKATASKEAKDLVFKNVYTPVGAANVTLGAKKVLEGKTLEAGKYNFELKKEDGTVVETATNAADGTVTFSPISYDENQVGTHKYTISEVAGSESGVTYDTTIQEVEVKVEKVSATELKATASKEAKDLVFKNVYTTAKTEVPVNKIWKDADNQDGKRPSSITVKLLADGQETNQTLVLNVANNWAGSFTNLDTDKGGASIKYTVVEEPVTGYTSEVTGDATSGFIITNTYTPETVDVTVTKNWNDNNDQDGKRPSSITVNLLADGTKVDSREIQAAADGTWTAKFEKLAKYKDGKEIKYAVTEESVVGYKSSIDNFTITNSHDPEKINISGTKVWNDDNDQDGKRPTKITVQVLKGEQVVAEVEVSAETDWKFEFKDLPKYEKGKEITYELKEVSVEHYTTKVTGKDGKYTITNTHTPAKINVKGQKIWDDANNKDGIRPDSIVVKLLANGVETGKTATASAASSWTYEFTDLDRYQDGGKEIVYTIKEANVPKGYTSEVNGTNIVNHHKPKDPEPNKPQDPEPNKPQDPEPNKPKDPEPGKPGQKPQLPNTGEKVSKATVVAGLALMVITGGLYFVSRKNK